MASIKLGPKSDAKKGKGTETRKTKEKIRRSDKIASKIPGYTEKKGSNKKESQKSEGGSAPNQ